MSSMPAKSGPRVGVGVVVLRDGKVIVGKRKGSLAAGTWALPGGHLECGESFEACAQREVREETGLEIRDVHFVWASNCVIEGQHYVTIFMCGSPVDMKQEPQTMEPDKCEGWHWHSLRSVPEPLFAPLAALLGSGYNPCDDTEAMDVMLGTPVSMHPSSSPAPT